MKRLLPTLFSFLLLAGVVLVQKQYDTQSIDFQQEVRKAELSNREPLLPSLPALKLLSLGNEPLLADIIWLNTIQYFGSGNPYGSYASLAPLLDTVTQLDPKFEYPYEFGLVVLPFMNATDTAIRMGERAQQELPGRGLLTFYLASDYQLNVKDYRKAAYYYQKAAKEPGAPGAAERLAGISLAQLNQSLNDRLVALEFWKAVYENAEDPDEKERAEGWFQHRALVHQLEEAAQGYKQETGSFPASLDELVAQRRIPSVPLSPIGRQLILDPQTGTIDFSKLRAE